MIDTWPSAVEASHFSTFATTPLTSLPPSPAIVLASVGALEEWFKSLGVGRKEIKVGEKREREKDLPKIIWQYFPHFSFRNNDDQMSILKAKAKEALPLNDPCILLSGKVGGK